MKILLAGPWLGEFGWELMKWQAHIRKVVSQNKYDMVVCIVRTGHQFLYLDFADEFVFVDKEGARNGWRLNEDKPTISSDILDKYDGNDIDKIEPFAVEFEDQEFVKYEMDSIYDYDLLFHCRSTAKLNTQSRNWPIERWEALRDRFEGLKIACVGSESESVAIEGVEDIRGCGLSKLAAVCNNAKMIIGPSSGPMHFASLCGCPHVVFTDRERRFYTKTNRYRYEQGWNPFGTKAIVVDNEGWQPSVETVIKAIEIGLGNVE